MFGLSKLRLVEIGIALLLTLAALIFVGLTVWAAETGRISVADAWASERSRRKHGRLHDHRQSRP
jgi:hypothetical protein